MDDSETILQRCIKCETSRDYLTEIKKLSKDILDNKINLVKVTESLGDYLTNNEAEKRQKGLRILGDVINNLPRNYLKSEEANHFIQFYVERLKDTLVISDALRGLRFLSSVNCLTFEQVDFLLTSIFQDLFTQSLLQIEREHVFTIFNNLLYLNLPEIKLMDMRFLTGFIQAMEGEKDPRNLLLLFNLIPFIVNNFDTDMVVEDIFEVTACYFPIDYSPPPDDPRGIKREDLVLGLRKVLASSTKFAENLLPLLLEKFDSDLKSAKIDALETLVECCKIYKWKELQNHYTEIWKSIRREVFTTTIAEVKSLALITLTEVFKTTVHRNSENENADYELLVKNILDECVGYINQSDPNFFNSTVALLNALFLSTNDMRHKIFPSIFPMLLNRYTLSVELQHCKFSIEAVALFLTSQQKMNQNETFGPLMPYKNTVLSICSNIIENSDSYNIKQAAVDGLLALSLTHSALNTNELQKVMELFVKLVTDPRQTSLSTSCVFALTKLCESAQTVPIITASILPQIMQNIMEIKNQNATLEEDSIKLQIQFKVIVAVSRIGSIVEIAVTKLLEELKTMPEQSTSCILICINAIAKNAFNETTSSYWINCVLLPLTCYLKKLSSGTSHFSAIHINVCSIFHTIVLQLSVSETKNLFFDVIKIYLPQISSLVNYDFKAIQNEIIVLMDAIIGSAKKELFLPCEEIAFASFTTGLCDLTFKMIGDANVSSELSLTACKCLSKLLNKYPNDKLLEEIVKEALNSMKTSLNKFSTLDKSIQTRFCQLLIWLTKALIMRNHQSVIQYIETLLSCLEDETFSEAVAKEFYIVQTDFEDYFNAVCHANISILYKQRFFLLTYQKLIDGFHKSSEATKFNYLTALVSQLTLIPKDTFIAEAPNLMPTLIKGLTTNHSQLLVSILSTLLILIRTTPNIIEAYCDTLLQYLLNLTTFKETMKIRIAALQCLTQITTLPTYLIQKHKQEVIQRLVISLDDYKRLVRKEAAVARSSWFLVGC